jgi:membrane protease subunit HflK
VASARADAVRIINEAQGYANDVIPKARGEARRMMEEAEGYKQKKINEAEGDASRFAQIAAEYSKASQVTSDRLYAEAMEQILPKIKKIFLDQNGNVDLTIVRRGGPASTAPLQE